MSFLGVGNEAQAIENDWQVCTLYKYINSKSLTTVLHTWNYFIQLLSNLCEIIMEQSKKQLPYYAK